MAGAVPDKPARLRSVVLTHLPVDNPQYWNLLVDRMIEALIHELT